LYNSFHAGINILQ